MYWKLLAAEGTPAERFGSLMDMINNDSTLQPIVEAMISDSDHSELAKAFSYMFKSDSTDGGNYEIKEDLSDLDTMSAEGKANSGVTDAKVADARKAFELGISDAKIRDLEKYNENLDELATLLTQVGKGGKNAADAMQTINSKMDQNRYNRWALNQYKSGDRSETVTKQLSSRCRNDRNSSCLSAQEST